MTNTKVHKVDPLRIDPAVIQEAAAILDRGGLVVFPTETVYGIGANLLHKGAMERLTKIKDRPQGKHFTIHICDKDDVERYVVGVSPRAYKLMGRFWPGPLTIVLCAPHDKTVGLRMPKNGVALALLGSVDFPVVAPSANKADQPAPRDAAGVLAGLDGLVDLVLDGGPTELGRESTVVDLCGLPAKILREGVLPADDVLQEASKKTVLFVCTGNSCRSVMAEYLLKKYLVDQGRKDVDVVSAGTFAFLGMLPTHETAKLIRGIGLDASDHRARRATDDLVRQSDVILTMERRHQEDLMRQFPSEAGRIHLLGEYVGLEPFEAEVEDPIGKSEEFYADCFSKIKNAIQKLGALL